MACNASMVAVSCVFQGETSPVRRKAGTGCGVAASAATDRVAASMPARDVLLTRPWFEPVVFGLRRAFTWEPIYLGRMRLRYAMVYWNPTPGAVLTVAGERLLPDRRHLLFIPAGTWFERGNERPFDHVWCHLRVRSEPARPGQGPNWSRSRASWRPAWRACGATAGASGSPTPR